MSLRVWSFVLQWSRVGINAAFFLIATRYLSLVEIGAFAPVRLTQGLHKAGICEGVIVLGRTQRRQDALFALSLAAGLAATLLLTVLALVLQAPLLLVLGAVPLINGIGAVPEGLLRRTLRLRALALRTMLSQTIAATLAVGMLLQGGGVWALVTFALANAVLTATLSIRMARWIPRSLPSWRYQKLLLPKTSQIAARDILGAALLPLAQLAVGLGLGLSAAGAFQIATRVLSLIDALALSPLRGIALPQMRAIPGAVLAPVLANHLRLTAMISVWIWGCTIAAAQDIIALLAGPAHAAATAPILIALAGFGLISALSMPLNQALTARGHTRLMLARAALLLASGTVFMLPTMWLSAVALAASLSLAALLTTIWHLRRALPCLRLTLQDFGGLCAPIVAGVLMLSGLMWLPPLPLVAKIVVGSLIYATSLTLASVPKRSLA